MDAEIELVANLEIRTNGYISILQEHNITLAELERNSPVIANTIMKGKFRQVRLKNIKFQNLRDEAIRPASRQVLVLAEAVMTVLYYNLSQYENSPVIIFSFVLDGQGSLYARWRDATAASINIKVSDKVEISALDKINTEFSLELSRLSEIKQFASWINENIQYVK